MYALDQLKPNSLYERFWARTIFYQWDCIKAHLSIQITHHVRNVALGCHSWSARHKKSISPLNHEKSPSLNNTALLRSSSSWVRISQLIFYTLFQCHLNYRWSWNKRIFWRVSIQSSGRVLRTEKSVWLYGVLATSEPQSISRIASC